MLSTSYEAFYAMDNLRHRSNLTFAQMAQLMDWDADQYRITQRKVMTGQVGGLNGSTDLKMRKGLELLLIGFKLELLPIVEGNSISARNAQRKSLEKLKSQITELLVPELNDPTGYIEARLGKCEQLIHTDHLLVHAEKYSPGTF